MNVFPIYNNVTHVLMLPASWEQRKRPDQLQGTVQEKVVEVSGRSCYDSIGTGRSSADFHSHLLEVGHGSVHEHVNFTTMLTPLGDYTRDRVALCFLNRPGFHVLYRGGNFRITANLRSVYEWDNWSTNGDGIEEIQSIIGKGLKAAAHILAPSIIPNADSPLHLPLVAPVYDEEKWYSFMLEGSRGFSHELVRHKYRTAVSQRSTRYVDESESPWEYHPLLMQYLDENPDALIDDQKMADVIAEFQDASRKLYDKIVDYLQPWIVTTLPNDPYAKFTARKQARGAARGMLGNALRTDMVFSASLAQWKRIIKQRVNPAADREINDIIAKVVKYLPEG